MSVKLLVVDTYFHSCMINSVQINAPADVNVNLLVILNNWFV